MDYYNQGQFFQWKPKVVYLLIFLIVLMIVGVGVFFYITRKQPAQKQNKIISFQEELKRVVVTKSQFKTDQKIIQVGEETIYGTDLNNILFTFYYSDYISPTASTQLLEEKLLAKAQENSLILQEAEKNGLIDLSQSTFNNSNKDIIARNTLIETTKQKLEEKFINRISGEAISIWFHNGSWPEPKIGYDKAKIIAREKLESIYSDLKSGKITFLQAKDKITNDETLVEIDPSYKANAYISFEDRDNTRSIFNDPEVNKKTWELKSGEMSEILTANDIGDYGKPYEALFKIIKINKKSAGEFTSFDNWLNAKKTQYEIKKY